VSALRLVVVVGMTRLCCSVLLFVLVDVDVRDRYMDSAALQCLVVVGSCRRYS
jgi:hypothetical protein